MELRINQIVRKRLTEEIIDQLTSLIERGELTSGDKLPPERRLMRQFGVGRSSVREAVGALSLTGVLSVRPGSGTRVISSADAFLISCVAVGSSVTALGRIVSSAGAYGSPARIG